VKILQLILWLKVLDLGVIFNSLRNSFTIEDFVNTKIDITVFPGP
jgi:hypothetical protein